MIIEAALRGHLLASPGIASMVDDRVYANRMPPDGGFPVITFQRISTLSQESLSGASGLERVRFQIDAWAKGYAAAINLAEQVRLSIQGFRGIMGAVTVHGVMMLNRNDQYEDDTDLHKNSMDFALWHQQTKP